VVAGGREERLSRFSGTHKASQAGLPGCLLEVAPSSRMLLLLPEGSGRSWPLSSQSRAGGQVSPGKAGQGDRGRVSPNWWRERR